MDEEAEEVEDLTEVEEAEEEVDLEEAEEVEDSEEAGEVDLDVVVAEVVSIDNKTTVLQSMSSVRSPSQYR